MCLTAVLGSLWTWRAQGQAITIQGVTDRQDLVGSASFRVVTNVGFSYEVTLNGVPKPAGITNTILIADYYDLVVRRTNLSDSTVTNALVRFIIRASDRGDTERGLIAWVPYPSIPSTTGELAGAHIDLVAPDTYPNGMEIPLVAWVRNASGGAVRANGSLTAAGWPNLVIKRGVGSGFLPMSAPGEMSYFAQLPGISASKAITVEASTTWTTPPGTLSGAVNWPAGSRISLTTHLSVSSGATLTIGAGTVVRLGSGINITNLGGIVINGTESQPVVFTPVTRAQPWGGFFLTVPTARIEGNGVIFMAACSRQSGFPGHRNEQPLFNVTTNNTHIALTNAAMIALAGQLYHSLEEGTPYSTVTMVRTLIQGGTTCGEFNGASLRFLEGAMLDMPYEDPFYCADVDCDHDGFYLNEGTHEIRDSLLGWVKDDAVDAGSGGGPTSVTVSNCWVEGTFHEALAWSGGGRSTRTFDTVLINNGQGLECGWSTGTSPLVDGRRVLSLANGVGVRYGDNYSGTTGLGLKSGYLTNNDCIVLHNHRDVWGQVWDDTWNYRVSFMTINNNYLTAVNTNHPNNTVWDPAAHGPLLAPFMSTPPNAPVGIGVALWPHQRVPSMLTNGVAVRLSSFTVNPVSVNYSVKSSASTLAEGTLTFTAGETVKRITLPPAAVAGLELVQVKLSNPVGGELTGDSAAYLAGATTSAGPPPGHLIPSNSVWRFSDVNGDLGTGWRVLNYAETGWGTGPAELGFGDTADGRPEATMINGGPANPRTPTIYFRHKFNVADTGAYTNLFLGVLRDDGAVAYLNNQEVYRGNVPAGQTYGTYTGASTSSETQYFPTNINPALLVTGTNILAVEVHQGAVDSSDLSFNLLLVGQPLPPPALSSARFGSDLVLFWSDPTFVLESTTALPGGWQQVIPASSPYTVVPEGQQKFYRLRR